MPSACPDGMNDAAAIRAAIEKEAAAQNVDVNLALAIADQETLFGRKLNAERSLDKGARGPMQLMPATAERFGVKDACDLNENIRGGVAYLKELSAQFGGNVIFVASAYNAGEGRVIQAGGVPPFAGDRALRGVGRQYLLPLRQRAQRRKSRQGARAGDYRKCAPGLHDNAIDCRRRPEVDWRLSSLC